MNQVNSTVQLSRRFQCMELEISLQFAFLLDVPFWFQTEKADLYLIVMAKSLTLLHPVEERFPTRKLAKYSPLGLLERSILCSDRGGPREKIVSQERLQSPTCDQPLHVRRIASQYSTADLPLHSKDCIVIPLTCHYMWDDCIAEPPICSYIVRGLYRNTADLSWHVRRLYGITADQPLHVRRLHRSTADLYLHSKRIVS